MFQPGTRVRLTETAKQYFREHNSAEHIAEFGDCDGQIVGPTFQDSVSFLDVRWEPSQLKYGYHVDHLEQVQ